MDEDQRRAPGLWAGMKQAVSALVAEMATMDMLVAEPDRVLRVRPSGIDVLRAGAARTELLFTAAGRPIEAVKAVIGKLGPQASRGLRAGVRAGPFGVEPHGAACREP